MPFHEGQQSSPGTCWPYPRPSLGSSQEAGPQPSLPPLHEPQAGRLSAENQQDGDKARPQLRSRPAAERFRPESQCCCPQLEKVLDPRLSWKEGARTFWKNWMALEPCPTPPQDTVKGLEQGRVDLKPTPKPRVRPKPASSGRGFLGHWTLVLTRQTGCWGASAPHSCMELSRHRAGTQIHPRDGALPHTPSARSRHRHIRPQRATSFLTMTYLLQHCRTTVCLTTTSLVHYYLEYLLSCSCLVWTMRQGAPLLSGF